MKINISMHTQENVNNKGNVCMKKKIWTKKESTFLTLNLIYLI